MTTTVTASGTKDEVKASVQSQATHPGHHGPLCALVDGVEGTHASVSCTLSRTGVQLSISAWTVAPKEEALAA